jgi:hypothetical protein
LFPCRPPGNWEESNYTQVARVVQGGWEIFFPARFGGDSPLAGEPLSSAPIVARLESFAKGAAGKMGELEIAAWKLPIRRVPLASR